MTRRVTYTVVVLALLTLVGSVAYRLAPVQDFLMKRGALLAFGGTAEPFDGLQAVVCGSASPPPIQVLQQQWHHVPVFVLSRSQFTKDNIVV